MTTLPEKGERQLYGSIFHLHPKPGQKAAIRQLFEQWDRERASRLQGFHASYLFQPDLLSDELIGVAIFEDRESYRKNAADPKQDEWYRSLRTLLTEDPRWEDGEIIEAAERT